VLASIAVGAKAIPLGHVWDALWSPAATEDDLVVRTLRLPRTVLGILVGVAGALMQGHTRNPPVEVLTAELLRAVFDLEAQVIIDPVAGTRSSCRWAGATGAEPHTTRHPRCGPALGSAIRR
jgi:hypothetical protein